jgi:hypothetical protein
VDWRAAGGHRRPGQPRAVEVAGGDGGPESKAGLGELTVFFRDSWAEMHEFVGLAADHPLGDPPPAETNPAAQLRAHSEQQEAELAQLRARLSLPAPAAAAGAAATSVASAGGPQQHHHHATTATATAGAAAREVEAQRAEASGWRGRFQRERGLREAAEGALRELSGAGPPPFICCICHTAVLVLIRSVHFELGIGVDWV